SRPLATRHSLFALFDLEALLQELAVALPDLQRPGAGDDLPGSIEGVAAPVIGADRGREIGDGLAVGVVVRRVDDAGLRNLPHRSQHRALAVTLADRAEANAEADADARARRRRLRQDVDFGNIIHRTGDGAGRRTRAGPSS